MALNFSHPPQRNAEWYGFWDIYLYKLEREKWEKTDNSALLEKPSCFCSAGDFGTTNNGISKAKALATWRSQEQGNALYSLCNFFYKGFWHYFFFFKYVFYPGEFVFFLILISKKTLFIVSPFKFLFLIVVSLS